MADVELMIGEAKAQLNQLDTHKALKMFSNNLIGNVIHDKLIG